MAIFLSFLRDLVFYAYLLYRGSKREKGEDACATATQFTFKNKKKRVEQKYRAAGQMCTQEGQKKKEGNKTKQKKERKETRKKSVATRGATTIPEKGETSPHTERERMSLP
jgi:hypothetical protein